MDRQMVDITSSRGTPKSPFFTSSFTLIKFSTETIVGCLDRVVQFFTQNYLVFAVTGVDSPVIFVTAALADLWKFFINIYFLSTTTVK
jgi:hypothetical protein